MPLVTILLDPSTDLILAQRYGPSMQERYSDYRNRDGLQVAFTTVLSRDGLPIVTRRVRTFDYNIPLDADLFTKPS
jgi:hypothetical protein